MSPFFLEGLAVGSRSFSSYSFIRRIKLLITNDPVQQYFDVKPEKHLILITFPRP
jgi:hypothetical protein